MAYNNLIRTETENKIAKEFFVNFTNCGQVSKKLYPEAFISKKNGKSKKKIKTLGIISESFYKWKEAKYIDESKNFFIEKISSKGKHFTKKEIGYSLNFNFLFDYLNSKHLSFTKEEKESDIFNWIFNDDKLRIAILREFPEENLINATLNFYVKNLINRYHLLLEIIPRKLIEKYNNPKTEEDKRIKRIHDKLSKTRNITLLDYYVLTLEEKTINDTIFKAYFKERRRNKDLILSIDRKILSALNLNPMI